MVADQDQKFFIIFQINDFYLGKASPKYAAEVIHALRQAEGHLKFSVKRAQIREVVYIDKVKLPCLTLCRLVVDLK